MSLHNQTQLSLDLRSGPRFDSYRKKDINPLSGVTKNRTIFAPNAPMRQIQAVLLRELRELEVQLPHATACRPGSKLLDHVTPHQGRQYVVQYDLEDAYGSVRADRLVEVLSVHGRKGCWLAEASLLFSMNPGGGLVTGAASSPDLFNLYAGELLDEPLERLLRDWGDVAYTRYLDDLVFSSDKPIGRRRRSQILTIVRKAGFSLSQHKTRISDLAVDNHVVINGVGLRITGELFVARSYKRRLFTMIKQAQAGEVDLVQLAGYMGAFYASVGNPNWLTGSEKRINQMYQELLAKERRHPDRVAHRSHRRRSYRLRMKKAKRRELQRRYRARHYVPRKRRYVFRGKARTARPG